MANSRAEAAEYKTNQCQLVLTESEEITKDYMETLADYRDHLENAFIDQILDNFMHQDKSEYIPLNNMGICESIH